MMVAHPINFFAGWAMVLVAFLTGGASACSSINQSFGAATRPFAGAS